VRILLTGRNGQVGWELERTLAPFGDVIAVDRKQLDLADEASIRRATRAAAPDVPTLTESGIPVQSVVWFGMLAPAATPKPVLAKLNDAVNRALAEPDLREKFQSTGTTVEGGSAAEFQALIDRESAHWARLIKEAGIRAD